ncbi:Membrane bound hydrogenase subunit mbhH [Caloramator quimbayensis]|uniref:Membrane bound hydrogenase subunit mbhH n=1 Tax=Caloramator quimbayensis TaxID=1147123 RepID=A0A1T4X0Z6_9CLOT|nr:proton-conducting transporter membrane subunit [Caloramator quimbayensis]SKA83323.1 Membrane bound hydrogenase subunit mbhH [Caloramator quimbayensis]
MMQHYPVLSIIILFLGAFLNALFGGKSSIVRNIITFLSTGTSFLLILLLIKPIMLEGKVISYWMGNWIPVSDWAIGIGLEVDQLSLFFALLVSFTVFLSGIYSFKYMENDDTLDKYYVLYLMLSGGVMGFVLSGDIFNMFVMIEIFTFAAVALTAFRNYIEGALEAAFKYIVIGSIGSSFILAGTTLLYAQLHTLNMAQIAALMHKNYTPITLFSLGLMFTGYAVKSFIVPCHAAAPDAYMTAPSSISMLFSGMVNKAGVYGMIRLLYMLFQSINLPSMQILIIILGTITMFIGVTMALIQNDFKRLLAFHSISQIGYVITGIGLSTALGITGGLYHALNHTLFKGLLFLCAGAVFYSVGTTDLNKLGGLAKKMPHTALIFLIGAFSISGLPPFNGFVSKWLIYQSAYEEGFVIVTIIALLVSVLTLASFIKVTQSVFFGQLSKECENAKEVPIGMRIPMWIMAFMCFITGILPQYVTKYLITPAVSATLNIGKYIDAMLKDGYAEKYFKETVPVPNINYKLAGYWRPEYYLILFIIILLAFTLTVLAGGIDVNRRSIVSKEIEDYKYDTFYSGEKSEYSQVGGADLFWGLKYDFRKYFNFMHSAHSGVVNDYTLWIISTAAIVIAYIFLLVP